MGEESCLELSGECGPADTSISDFRFQKWERINFYCSKLPSPCYCVTLLWERCVPRLLPITGDHRRLQRKAADTGNRPRLQALTRQWLRTKPCRRPLGAGGDRRGASRRLPRRGRSRRAPKPVCKRTTPRRLCRATQRDRCCTRQRDKHEGLKPRPFAHCTSLVSTD